MNNDSIFAVIVTYNPEVANLEKLVGSLKESNVKSVIVDNGSFSRFSLPCETLWMEDNLGIAKAQNEGIKYCTIHNAEYIIFFDQDSTIPDSNFINQLTQPLINGDANITAPIFVDKDRGFTYPIVEIFDNGCRKKHFPLETQSPFWVNNVISSGTTVTTKVMEQVGGMNEDFFIDYVDTEWCLRAYNLGHKILVVPQAKMFHSIGDKSLKLWKFYVPKHSAFRRYYRLRNSFFLFRLSHVPKIMALREIVFSIVHQSILIAASPNERKGYVKSLIRGVKDGIKRR
ncbi:rhamnosyltransferase [uncultured Vibrio sp.]|uniref:rhamnosyltransferase n=1 Tax=uncultured Vibrio sp. TaxID=114054 RepID=UPI00262A80DC|nr:rhamnosyltransferase [uncultured Vibrio sp.]